MLFVETVKIIYEFEAVSNMDKEMKCANLSAPIIGYCVPA